MAVKVRSCMLVWSKEPTTLPRRNFLYTACRRTGASLHNGAQHQPEDLEIVFHDGRFTATANNRPHFLGKECVIKRAVSYA